MPPVVVVSKPSCLAHYYRLKRVPAYDKEWNGHVMTYDYKLYSWYSGALLELTSTIKKGANRPYLKHRLMKSNGTYMAIDLHRLAALNYAACNEDDYDGHIYIYIYIYIYIL